MTDSERELDPPELTREDLLVVDVPRFTNTGVAKQAVVEDVMVGQARTKELMTPDQVANRFTFGFSAHGTHLTGGDLTWDGGYTTTYV